MRLSVKILISALCAAIPAATALAQDKPTCPHGAAGDWSWRVTMSDMTVENKVQPITWQTVGGEKTSQGMEIRIASLHSLDKVSSVYLKAAPPTFDVKPENSEYTYRLFNMGKSTEGEDKVLASNISYFLMGVDSTGGEDVHFMSGRVEQNDVHHKMVTGGWLGTGPDDDLGWRMTEVKALRIVIATQDFRPGGYGQPKEGYDNLAVSDAIDLSALEDVWAIAREARDTESARAWESNLTCAPA